MELRRTPSVNGALRWPPRRGCRTTETSSARSPPASPPSSVPKPRGTRRPRAARSNDNRAANLGAWGPRGGRRPRAPRSASPPRGKNECPPQGAPSSSDNRVAFPAPDRCPVRVPDAAIRCDAHPRTPGFLGAAVGALRNSPWSTASTAAPRPRGEGGRARKAGSEPSRRIAQTGRAPWRLRREPAVGGVRRPTFTPAGGGSSARGVET